MTKCIDCKKLLKNPTAKRCWSCHMKWRNLKGNNPNFKKDKPKCKICNKEIGYCSKICWKCYSKTLKGTGNPMHGVHRFGKDCPGHIDGRTLKTYNCVECKKKISYKTWRYGLCMCKSCSHKGKRSAKYIHGQGNFPYPMEFNSILKKQIRARDNYTCQKCGLKEKNHIRGKKHIKLTIHHINYIKQDCKPDNLISLCHRCNVKVSSFLDYWYSYFIYIMENR